MDPPCHWRVADGAARHFAPRGCRPALPSASPTRARAHELDHFSVGRRSRVAPWSGAAVPRHARHRCRRRLRRAPAYLEHRSGLASGRHRRSRHIPPAPGGHISDGGNIACRSRSHPCGGSHHHRLSRLHLLAIAHPGVLVFILSPLFNSPSLKITSAFYSSVVISAMIPHATSPYCPRLPQEGLPAFSRNPTFATSRVVSIYPLFFLHLAHSFAF